MLPNIARFIKRHIRSVFHTGYDINATDGSRTAITAAKAIVVGQVVQWDSNNHEGVTEHPVVGEHTSGAKGMFAIVESLTGDPVNSLRPGSASALKGGIINVTTKGECLALVKASSNLAAGDLVSPWSSGTGFNPKWLINNASTTVAHLKTRTGADGANQPFAEMLEACTTAETSGGAVLKRVRIITPEW